MKKTLLRILTGVALLGLFVSCDDDDEVNESSTVTETLSIDTSSMSFAYDEYGSSNAQTATISGTSGTISAKSSDSWLSCSVSGDELTVYPASANAGDERKATVTVSSTTADNTVTVTVTQAAGTMGINTTELTFAYDACDDTSAQTITVSGSTENLSVSSEVEWLTCAVADGGITVYANEANAGEEARTGTVTVTDSETGNTATITVTQEAASQEGEEGGDEGNEGDEEGGNEEGGDEEGGDEGNEGGETEPISVSTETMSFAYSEYGSDNAQTATISGNTANISVSADEDWVTYSIEGNVLSVYPASINSGEMRNATVTVIDLDTNDIATIFVSQADGTIGISASTMTFAYDASDNTSAQTATITGAIDDITASADADWISVSLSEGVLTVYTNAVNAEKLRAGTVTVTNNITGNTVTVTVKQSSGTISVSPALMSFSYDESGSSVALTAEVSGPTDNLSVSTEATWLVCSIADGVVTVYPNEANAGNSRTATVTVESSVTGNTATISVTQVSGTMSVSPSEMTFAYSDKGEEYAQTASVTGATGELSVSTDDSWISASVDGSTVTVYTSTMNSTGKTRTGSVTVTDLSTGNATVIYVSQEAYTVDVGEGGEGDGSSGTIEW